MNYNDYEKIKADIKEKLSNGAEWILAAAAMVVIWGLLALYL